MLVIAYLLVQTFCLTYNDDVLCTSIIPADVAERDSSVSRTDDTHEYVHHLQPDGSNDENRESATSPYEYVDTDEYFDAESSNTPLENKKMKINLETFSLCHPEHQSGEQDISDIIQFTQCDSLILKRLPVQPQKKSPFPHGCFSPQYRITRLVS